MMMMETLLPQKYMRKLCLVATGSSLPMYFYLQACVELSVTLTL